MEIGIDDADDYYCDVFGRLDELGATEQTDMRSLVRFSRRVAGLDEVGRQALVVAHGTFSPDIGDILGPSGGGYENWSSMIGKWADEFLGHVDLRCPAPIKRILGL